MTSTKHALDLEIQSRFLMSREYRECNTLLIYISCAHEIATDGIIAAALANGKRVAAPVCGESHSMIFREIHSRRDLVSGAYGILEPNNNCTPLYDFSDSVCVCPALCCDMQGFRLGFGGGYYDRFLRGYDGKAVGLCYSDAVVPNLPIDEFDIPLSAVFTDSYVRYHHKEDHYER